MCGITRLEDAKLAVDMGADCIGFIFAPSPRQITPEKACSISMRIGNIKKAGVFVNEDPTAVKNIRNFCELDIVQLHGNESPEYCQAIGGKIIKAIRVKEKQTLENMQYPGVWKILLDTYHPKQAGGTGKRIDADLLSEINDFSQIIMAGGINADNVLEVIGKYQPFGIDVNSGVESAPGIKDKNKVMELYNNLRKK